MSFAPVMGPGSHTHLYLQSSVHACFASLAALCSSLLASIYALVDNLAARMPSAYCPVCRYNARRAINPTENTSPEDKITAVVFDPGTGFCTLKRLEDIDGEYRAAFSVPLSGLHCSLRTQWRKPSSAISCPAQYNPLKSSFPLGKPNPLRKL